MRTASRRSMCKISILPAKDSVLRRGDRKCWVCYGVLALSAGILVTGSSTPKTHGRRSENMRGGF